MTFKRKPPSDGSSFIEFLYGLTRKINRLRKHLNINNVRDIVATQSLHQAMVLRDESLSSPPASVSPAEIEKVKAAIRGGL